MKRKKKRQHKKRDQICGDPRILPLGFYMALRSTLEELMLLQARDCDRCVTAHGQHLTRDLFKGGRLICCRCGDVLSTYDVPVSDEIGNEFILGVLLDSSYSDRVRFAEYQRSLDIAKYENR